jgi:hypothetical protein
MVALRCTCEQGTNLWGEFWWIEGEHRWVFFDDEKTSETYAEQLPYPVGRLGGAYTSYYCGPGAVNRQQTTIPSK